MIRIHRCWRPFLKTIVLIIFLRVSRKARASALVQKDSLRLAGIGTDLIAYTYISFVKFNAIDRKASSKIWHIVSRVYKYVNLETCRPEDITPYAGNNGPIFSPMTFVEDIGVVSVLASSRSISCFGDSVVAGKERERWRKKNVCASRYCEFASGHLRI